jgi:Domain of unknown function (DUF1841)
MYTDNREAYRQTFFQAWQKYQQRLPLTALESTIVDVILLHPEYHELLANPQCPQEQFSLTDNPFVHLSLHISIQEQLHADRPKGIRTIYQRLTQQMNSHEAVHSMINCLMDVMWKAQQSGMPPDEMYYIDTLRTKL